MDESTFVTREDFDASHEELDALLATFAEIVMLALNNLTERLELLEAK